MFNHDSRSFSLNLGLGQVDCPPLPYPPINRGDLGTILLLQNIYHK